MKTFKRVSSVLIMMCMVAGSMIAFAGSAAALAGKDYSYSGSYYVSGAASGHDYCYMYSLPSSSRGKNLATISEGEAVQVFWCENGLANQNTIWAYCAYGSLEGYILWDDLSSSIGYDYSDDPDGCAGWYIVDTVKPAYQHYTYIYSLPSSSHGKSLACVNDGTEIYVFWTENGLANRDTLWAYCEYDGVQGYILWENIR